MAVSKKDAERMNLHETIARARKKAEGYSQEEVNEMTKGSKKIYELIFVENFNVKDVATSSELISMIQGEVVIGGRNYPKTTGMLFRTMIDVEPLQDSPIRKLEFPSFSPVRIDDLIAATIPKYRIETIRIKGIGNAYDRGDRNFYFERGYNPEEKTIRIDILPAGNPKGKTLRSDISPGYANFFEKD
jgi:hypothetical protein